MLFNSFSYLVFLPVVFVAYWRLPLNHRKLLLLVASYVFYMSWRAEYGLLLLSLTVTNFVLGLIIDKYDRQTQGTLRKKFLIAGLFVNLACLSFYKYSTLLVDAVFSVMHFFWKSVNVSSLEKLPVPVLETVLPLGISFFVFEFIHYIVDVYKGSKPITSFKDFALFASFFPSQIAGPIKRFQDFRSQMCPSHLRRGCSSNAMVVS